TLETNYYGFENSFKNRLLYFLLFNLGLFSGLSETAFATFLPHFGRINVEGSNAYNRSVFVGK
ncbi:MAG: hypothetical protein AAFQ04_06640, partial [Pseudomonadota bacterium]